MRQVFDEPEIDEAAGADETELTLGSTGLLIVGAGLLVVCGLCFWLGYAAGHRGAPATLVAAAQPAPGSDSPLAASAAKQKPSAGPQPVAVASAAPGDSASAALSDPAPADPDADIVKPSGATPAPNQQPAGSQPSTSQWVVKPAFPQQAAQPLTGSGTAAAAPLASQAGTVMVQIAAVSHSEDAEVLVNALRRRGYAVSTRRDPYDNLIHVQVGPFANRNDANTVKLKLLNDGYNAIVEP